MDTILNRLIEGESLRRICADPDMPDRRTVMRWQDEDAEFDTKCARAREWQGDYMDDLILETANACTSETAQADRVKISAYQWRASKLAPKKYGEKVTQEMVGAGGGPIAVQTIERCIVLSPQPKRDVVD